MKIKLISIGVLLAAVIWFTSFLLGVNDAPVDHGQIVTSSKSQSQECTGWGIGSWSSVQCENVITMYARFEDGHIASMVISRKPIDQ